MRLVSSANASSNLEGNVPVSLFYYGERRKFIRVSEDYEDTIRALSRAFGIMENVGRISLQTSALDACKGRDIVIDESAYPLMWSFLEEITVVFDHEGGGRGPPETVASSSRRAKKAPESLPTPFPTPIPEEPVVVGPSGSDLLDFDSENPQDGRDDDQGLEEQAWEQEPNEEPPAPHIENSPFRFPAEQPASRTQKKFKKADTDGASSSAAFDDVFPGIKQEKMAQPTNDETPRRERSPKKEGQNLPPADDPRFEITIIGPGNSCAQFKTRGKHQVRKVLAAACKTFDIEYDRAQLVMGIYIEGDEGDMQMHEFVCAADETISSCGVSQNSKLFIKEHPDEDSD